MSFAPPGSDAERLIIDLRAKLAVSEAARAKLREALRGAGSFFRNGSPGWTLVIDAIEADAKGGAT